MSQQPLTLSPWSISKAQVAHSCTLRFNLKYVKREPGKEVERSEGRVGSAAHAIVEQCLKGQDYELAFRKGAIDNKLSRNEILTLATFKDPILTFLKRFAAWQEKMGVTPDRLFVEREVSFTRDFALRGYWDKDVFYRGLWDIGAVVHKGDKRFVVIIDHKTGQPGENLEKYKDQLWSYIVSAYALYPDLAGAQTAIHWMQAEPPQDPIMWGEMYKREQIVGEIVPWFLDYFDRATKQGTAPAVPTKGWYCDFCEYRHKCPLIARPNP